MTATLTFLPETTAARAQEGPDTTTIGAPRILVAEDHPGMLQLLTRTLRRQGYDVVVAHGGAELMQWVRMLSEWEDRVPLADLIVTDLRMPGFSGQDCIDRLHAVGHPIPVILITAFGSDEVHRQALAKGARAVLDKPLHLDDLCDLVQRHLPR